MDLRKGKDTNERLGMRYLLTSASRKDLHTDQRTNTVVACHWGNIASESISIQPPSAI